MTRANSGGNAGSRKVSDKQLSRRERQIMDVLYERRECSAHDVRAALPEAPSYSAVRALLAKMLERGYIGKREEGARYIYFPAQPVGSAREGALGRLVKTFFGGSTASAVTALLGMRGDDLDDRELAALEKVIEEARRKRQQDAPDENHTG